MAKLPLSLVIITLNEESNIERCIKSAAFVSEVVLFDSESKDRTCEIAQKVGSELGVQVVIHQQPWLGYGLQKRKATDAARYDWVLNLDADEALSPELAEEIQTKFHDLNPEAGYLIPRKSFHLGRWIMHGGWYPDRQLRLYHRKFSNWSDDLIHERVVALPSAKNWQADGLRSPLLHFVFRDLGHQIETNNKYSSLQAQAYLASGKKFSMFKLLVKPWSKFFECYFLKLGFLDGLPGFVIAVGAGYSVFLRWGKIWEQQTLKKG
jgi:glycosyltransferase involved in cell wall biosynthesis